MSDTKNLPDQGILLTLLAYDPMTGTLLWKERSPEQFEDSKGYAARVARSWNRKFAGTPALNTETTAGYLRGRLFRVEYLAHRIIWKMVTGEDPDSVDHIDHDRTNNRFANLRSVTHADNSQNMSISPRNTSGVVGVFWSTKEARWVAYIQKARLGCFIDFHDAVAARRAAEAKAGFHPNHGSPELKMMKHQQGAAA